MKIITILCKRFFSQKNTKNLVVSFKKETNDGYDKSQFFDCKIVKVFGGNGGDGCVSILREFCNAKGGPSGGDGGNGGHVIFQACSDTIDLRNVGNVIRADNGQRGLGKGMCGASGEHVYINVPVGTFIKCYKTDKLLSDLTQHGDIHISARGGQGGKGNMFFLSQEHRVPTIAEIGAVGESNHLKLEVKLLADIGLVGIPNAGKSSLLRALTRARPKVSPFAFSTLKPHIGIIQFEDYGIDPISVCDIPGIIEDSHVNRGLGLEFLRHIERCRILAFILDLNDYPIEQFSILLHELNCYRPILLTIPRLIICNKMDLPGTRAAFEEFKKFLTKTNDLSQIVAVSALHSSNIGDVVMKMKELKDRFMT